MLRIVGPNRLAVQVLQRPLALAFGSLRCYQFVILTAVPFGRRHDGGNESFHLGSRALTSNGTAYTFPLMLLRVHESALDV